MTFSSFSSIVNDDGSPDDFFERALLSHCEGLEDYLLSCRPPNQTDETLFCGLMDYIAQSMANSCGLFHGKSKNKVFECAKCN